MNVSVAAKASVLASTLASTLLLTACSMSRTVTEYDAVATQQINQIFMVFIIGTTVAAVAWAFAWAFVNRKGPNS